MASNFDQLDFTDRLCKRNGSGTNRPAKAGRSMKKKILLFASFLCGGSLLSGCVQEETKQDTTITAEVQLMEAVDSSQIDKEPGKTVPTESTTPKEKQPDKNLIEESKEKEDHTKLVQEYGEAYANFRNLNHRNEKLKDLMTEECIQMNGIDIETGNALGSEGKITSIYQNAQDEYAVLLDCIQNGSPIRVLLLARVENGKIAEMTYNTLKQEY
ncbi:MAG: EF0163 family protein [Enterococcus durans]